MPRQNAGFLFFVRGGGGGGGGGCTVSETAIKFTQIESKKLLKNLDLPLNGQFCEIIVEILFSLPLLLT